MPVFVLILVLLGAQDQPAAEDRSQEAARLMQVAADEITRGEYASAVRNAGRAASLYAAVGDRASEAGARNRVGQAALYAGDYGEAASSFRAAVDLSAAVGDREGVAADLSNLGNVHFFVGRYSEAARTYDEALAVVANAGATTWGGRRRRILLVNKAVLFQRLGQDQQALAIYDELGGAAELPKEEQAQLLVNRGVLYRRLGDPVKALTTYEQAQRLFAADRHVDGELGAMKNRGIVLALDLQRLDDAERAFSDVLKLAETSGNRRERLHALLYRGETRLRAGRASTADSDFSAALALARDLQTPEEEWKALYGRGRSAADAGSRLAHLEQAVGVVEGIRERIRVPSLRSDFFSDKTEVYDALIASRFRSVAPAEVFALIERSHSRAWRDRLGLSSAVDLQSVQQALDPGTLLLDYWVSAAGACVVAVTRTRATVYPVAVDETAVETLFDALAARTPGEWRAAARTLSSVLPPDDWFDGAKQVVVVAPGGLALVPFELLSTGGRLLIERSAVSYTPTAATLMKRSTQARTWYPPWHLQLRAFANPVFAESTLAEGSPRMLLAASQTEVTTIADEIAGRSAVHVAQDNLKAHLLRPDQPPLLHIASHAAASTTTIEQSRITFSAPSASGDSADYLFLNEAYGLPLGNVELAVLSACDTERGPLVRGEGVQSFSRAFLAAGAQSTVTTLWRVADAPTADLMAVFYHHLQRGESRASALRLAKLRLLQSGSSLAHPHYWAAFVLTGEGARPIPRAVSWQRIAAGAGALCVALLLGGSALRRRGRVASEVGVNS